MMWCSVPGASSRACRGILALALRLERWGTPSELFLSVNDVPHYRSRMTITAAISNALEIGSSSKLASWSEAAVGHVPEPTARDEGKNP